MRYSKQIILPDFGPEGQEKLSKASVLVIGAGGLGCPVLTYLAIAGIGRIDIIDFDVVEESNLPRQPLYFMGNIGEYKATVAADMLRQMNPELRITAIIEKLSAQNATAYIREYDIIADCTDNFSARYLINDTCMVLNKPWVFASIEGWQGQVSVFNYKGGPSYRDLYHEAPAPGDSPDCNEVGIIGTIAGITGSMQANEIIKCITGKENVLSGRLWIADLLNAHFDTISFKKAIPEASPPLKEENIAPGKQHALDVSIQKYLNNPGEYDLIDIREAHDFEMEPSTGRNISFDKLMNNLRQLDPSKRYMLLCKEGRKSLFVAYHLKEKYRLNNVFSLEGGWDKLKMKL